VRPAVVRPLAPARYQITVTVSAETHAMLLRVRDLLRQAIPSRTRLSSSTNKPPRRGPAR
jgi:hypothetical protein